MNAGRPGQWTQRPSKKALRALERACTRGVVLDAPWPPDLAKNQRGSEALHPPRHRKPARWAAAPLTLARRGLPAVIALLAAGSVAFATEPNHSGASEAIFFG